MSKIGIFGGTFDPPHMGHLQCAEIAMRELGLSKVLFIPNKIPAYKISEHSVSDENDRLAMLQLLVENKEWARISDIELKREGNTYTSDTLRELRVLYPNDELVLIIGSDSLCSLKNWHEPEEVCRLSTIAVLKRNTDSPDELSDCAGALENDYGAHIIILNNPFFDVSSTYIREAIKSGYSVAQFIPENIVQYIQKRDLYL